jgi:POT family proton-dependent oligopeptide transporter
MLLLILTLAFKQPTKDAKDKILAFAVLMIFGTIFWMLYQIGPMGLTVFIEHNIERNFSNWIIPPQWFQNINTVAIVVGGPMLGFVFNRMRRNGIQINIPTQFAIALFLIGLAFVLLPVGIIYANPEGLVSPAWIVISYVLQSIGELLISPIGYAMIGYLAPAPLQGVMMGMWMLNTGVGATLSSYSSNLMITDQQGLSPLITNAGYSHVFLMLGLFAVFSSFALFVLIPKLKTLIEEKKVMIDQVSDLEVTVPERVVLCE